MVTNNWYKHYKSNGITDYSIGDSFETKYNGVTTFYTFIFNSGGFVMVPADDIILLTKAVLNAEKLLTQ